MSIHAMRSCRSAGFIALIAVAVSPAHGANKVANGDFALGLAGWSTWVVRDGNSDFAAAVATGELSLSGSDIGGGVYQQVATGGAGSIVTVIGRWRSEPTLPDAMWAEVWVINADRVPVDGVDETDGVNGAVLLFRNDTFSGRGAWNGAIPKSAPVNHQVSFTAAASSATIILKTGNTGPATPTGVRFDDIEVRSVPPPGTIALMPTGFATRSASFPVSRMVSMAQSPVSRHIYAIRNSPDAAGTSLYRVDSGAPAISITQIPITTCGTALDMDNVQAMTFDSYGNMYVSTQYGEIYKGRDLAPDPAIDDFCFDLILDLPDQVIGTFHGVGGVAVGPDDMLYINSGSESHYGYLSDGSPEIFEDRYNARILRCGLEGGMDTLETFCEGIRNSFDITFRLDGKLFGVGNGPNTNCDYGEEFNLLEHGLHYGFPYKYGSDISGNDSSITCSSVGPTGPPPLPPGLETEPAWANYGPDAKPAPGEPGYVDGGEYYSFSPHRSPDGLDFYEPALMDPDAIWFPPEFHGRAFVAHFGELEPITPVGHDVTSMRLDEAHSGFVCNTFLQNLNRPIDVLCAHNGRLYVLMFEFSIASSVHEIAYTIPTAPMIGVEPAAIDRVVDYTENLPDDTFEVFNSGVGTLEYTISDDVDWLSVAPTGGTNTGQPDVITVSYDVAGKDIGTHHATITVSADEAQNNPKVIPVSVRVKTVRPDYDADGDVDQADYGHLQACLSGPGILLTGACENADLDNDLDADSADVAIFQGCLSGAGVIADKHCDDAYE